MQKIDEEDILEINGKTDTERQPRESRFAIEVETSTGRMHRKQLEGAYL